MVWIYNEGREWRILGTAYTTRDELSKQTYQLTNNTQHPSLLMTGDGHKAKTRHRDSNPLWNDWSPNLSDATFWQYLSPPWDTFWFWIAKHLQFVKLLDTLIPHWYREPVWKLRLLILDSPSFLTYTFSATKFPLNTIFIPSHRFWCYIIIFI